MSSLRGCQEVTDVGGVSARGRGYEAGPGGLEIIVIGAPNLGEVPREDVEGRRGWWAD